MRRALFVSGWLCLSVSGGLAVAQNSPNGGTAEPWAKLLGTWKQVPAPDDPTALKVEPEGGGTKFSFGCKQDGACADVIVGNYDGKPYKDAGNAAWEASFRKTVNRTIQEDGYLNGKLSRTGRWQLSSDGNTLTRTFHDVSPPGSKDFTFAYDRSGGPVSKDDPFIGSWKRDWVKSDAVVLTYTRKAGGFVVTDQTGVAHFRNCDGNDHADSATAEMHYSCHFTDENTEETLFKEENGKVASSLTTKVSEDGKKMVRIRKDPEGKTFSDLVFEKMN